MDTGTSLVAVAFSALGGTVVGFLLSVGLDLWRGRFQLFVMANGVREQLYGVRVKEPRYHVEIMPPDEADWWVITIDLTIVNAGYQPDAVLTCELRGDLLARPSRALLRADEIFHGTTVGPHSVETARLRFRLLRDDLAQGFTWGHLAATEKLRLLPITTRGSLRPVELTIADLGAPMFRPGDMIHYLHSSGS